MGKKVKVGNYIGNRFEVLKIFRGSMGVVYISYDHERNEIVALKTFKDKFMGAKSVLDSFKHEALAWVQLERHAYIVQAKYVINLDDRLYIALDYITPDNEGRNNLTHFLKSNLSLQQILKWSIQFCYGMEHSVERGVTPHRDIKPDNIMITQEGNVKITDFGLAKLWDREVLLTDWDKINLNKRVGLSFLKISDTKVIAGTLPYMAPEQFEGISDIRTDIYSFGVVLFQMVNNGKLPFDPEYEADYKNAHINDPVPKFDSVIAPIISKCLEKTPEKRYQDFKELRLDLKKIYQEELGAIPDLSPKEKELEDWEFYNKGLSFYSLGLYEEATQAFKEQLELCPTYEDCYHWHFDMGRIFKVKGLINQAINEFNEALKLNPNIYEIRINLGKALEEKGLYQGAIQEYRKAISLEPDNGEGYYYLGKIYENVGDPSNAAHIYKTFIKMALKKDKYFNIIKKTAKQLKSLAKKIST